MKKKLDFKNEKLWSVYIYRTLAPFVLDDLVMVGVGVAVVASGLAKHLVAEIAFHLKQNKNKV